MKIKDEESEIQLLDKFMKLRGLFKRLQQISWTINATEKRYPMFESLTRTELESFYKMYLAMSFDVSDIAEEMEKEYKEHTNKHAK